MRGPLKVCCGNVTGTARIWVLFTYPGFDLRGDGGGPLPKGPCLRIESGHRRMGAAHYPRGNGSPFVSTSKSGKIFIVSAASMAQHPVGWVERSDTQHDRTRSTPFRKMMNRSCCVNHNHIGARSKIATDKCVSFFPALATLTGRPIPFYTPLA